MNFNFVCALDEISKYFMNIRRKLVIMCCPSLTGLSLTRFLSLHFSLTPRYPSVGVSGGGVGGRSGYNWRGDCGGRDGASTPGGRAGWRAAAEADGCSRQREQAAIEFGGGAGHGVEEAGEIWARVKGPCLVLVIEL